jgi:pyruvate dehydrogenase E1 component beta subunit
LGGVMPEIVSRIQEESVDFLDGPILRIGSEDAPWPYNRSLEEASLPDVNSVIESFREGYKI